jgi:hypothetical protein
MKKNARSGPIACVRCASTTMFFFYGQNFDVLNDHVAVEAFIMV